MEDASGFTKACTTAAKNQGLLQIRNDKMLIHFFSSRIFYQFFLNCPKVCLLQEAEVHNLFLLSPCVAGQEQRSVMTNHLAWQVCITSKSHTLISSLLYQKLGCKLCSLDLNCLTPKLCLCLTMHSRQ